MQTRLFLVLLALFCALLIDVASATPVRVVNERRVAKRSLRQFEMKRHDVSTPSRPAKRSEPSQVWKRGEPSQVWKRGEPSQVWKRHHARTHPSVNALSSRFGLPDDRLINEFLLASCVLLASADVQ
ncbi:uncharacterized protein C8Q71DRAFT_200414 [Rhodofomes roseus]|uniref:Uncharacterized protein n=1 Tax=Rhodofomes roseus TaxID=34475 RepID=A0ABQ8KU84_9APHY|nr:uncharacterized protein C8Q71DRAFT_200414 [Rhodofomes roseus]KAH9842366.1 hypothetical protein C8Q71DRAFT_200414 [Rhodofomes roseus]